MHRLRLSGITKLLLVLLKLLESSSFVVSMEFTTRATAKANTARARKTEVESVGALLASAKRASSHRHLVGGARTWTRVAPARDDDSSKAADEQQQKNGRQLQKKSSIDTRATTTTTRWRVVPARDCPAPTSTS